MENIRSRNVYLKIVDTYREEMEEEEEEEEEKNKDFSDDVDGALTNKRKRKLPCWTRLTDGEEAKYADWTLDVNLSNNDASDIVSYSVHRYQLGLQSEYFKGIFRGPDEGEFSDSIQSRSTIKLPMPFVEFLHFEKMLDYLYTDKLVVDWESVVALIYFGDYFGINSLKEQAQTFMGKSIANATWELNISASSSMVLLSHYQFAKNLSMEELQEAIVYECASNPALMSKDTELSNYPDVQFWCRVLTAKKFLSPTELSNKLWSINVGHFIELHAEIVDREIFCQLTHQDSLPIISADVALVLMEQQRQRVEDIEEGRDNESTCLQQRCTDSLINIETGVWKIKNPHTLLEGRIGNIPRTVLESLLLLSAMNVEKKSNICYDRILVSGAGSKFVNGVYTRSGLHKGCPIFTRSGTYEGDNGLFYIYKSALHKSANAYWRITFTQEGVRLGENRELLFYATRNSGGDKLPPVNGWQSTVGRFPLPTFEFVFLTSI